ncbi:MAG: DNA internalization-related competence protein ComEC/Rec2 [Amphibacillus sp.]|nr:DNA internalization-related competence protein ComEC/Rec2 [Amphibacillus sp.]
MRGKGYLLVVSLFIGYYAANQLTFWPIVCLSWQLFLLIYYYRRRLRFYELIVLLLVALFFSQHFVYDPSDTLPSLEGEVQLTGTVNKLIKSTENHTSFILQEMKTNTHIQINVFTPLSSTPNQGAKCQIIGELQFPEHATNPGQFNYHDYLANQKIHYQMTINNEDQLACQGSSLVGRLSRIRDLQFEHVDQQFDVTISAWIKSLIFGDRSELDEQLELLFERWHLTHLLAISGLHVSIIVTILHVIFIYCCRFTKETTYQILIGFMLIYPVLGGGAPSIWRASLVMIFNYLAWYQRERAISLDFLSISFVLLLFLNPEWIFHLGFQFSYLISFSLLLSKQILTNLKSRWSQMWFVSGLCITVIIPIQLNTFYLFNPISIIVNLAVTFYFSTIFIPLIFTTYIASLILQPLLFVFVTLVNHAHNIFLVFIKFFDHYFYYPIVTGPLKPLLILLFYLCLIYILVHFEKKQFKQVRYGSMMFITIFIVQQAIPYLNPTGSVTMLDIGQANALVIELPYRRGVILYDVGSTLAADFSRPSERAYQQIIKPFLHYSGIDHIDAIILSHEDYDHLGSLQYLLADFTVDTVITSNYFQWPDGFEEFIDDERTRHMRVNVGESFSIGGQTFYCLSPIRDWQNPNDNSLVLVTTFGENRWLLTGDISEQVELSILRDYPDLSIDTLIVAHHGSQTSTSQRFLEQINPQHALIPVGRNNYFKHPSQTVIDRLNQLKIEVYRTDQDGAIQFIFKKHQKGGTFSTHLP